MDDINQIPFNFDSQTGIIVSVMVGILVFAVFPPVTGGMILRARRPNTVFHIRKAVHLSAGIVFTGIIAIIIGSNIRSITLLAQTALLPVILPLQ